MKEEIITSLPEEEAKELYGDEIQPIPEVLPEVVEEVKEEVEIKDE